MSQPSFSDDYYRMTGRRWRSEPLHRRILTLLNSHALRYLRAYRRIRAGEDPLGFFRLQERLLRRKTGLRLESHSIGRGLYLGHPYNIFVSGRAVLGENCNLNKGASIEETTEGDRPGAPVIGSRVWIGVNAVIRGGVTVGDNVLIAPNTLVEADVPDDSIVLGDPAAVHSGRKDAVEGYIHNEIIDEQTVTGADL